jgi:hypothetical protein
LLHSRHPTPWIKDPLDGGKSHHRNHLSQLLYNDSTASIQSNLFTHSWNHLGHYSVSELCSYIASTPPTPIRILKWCKDRNGVMHEFLLLEVERPGDRGIWLRLDRRPHKNARGSKLISSPALSDDTVCTLLFCCESRV